MDTVNNESNYQDWISNILNILTLNILPAYRQQVMGYKIIFKHLHEKCNNEYLCLNVIILQKYMSCQKLKVTNYKNIVLIHYKVEKILSIFIKMTYLKTIHDERETHAKCGHIVMVCYDAMHIRQSSKG